MRIISNTSGNLDPWAVTKDATNGIGNGADDARFTIGGLGHPAPGNAFAWADGVFPSTWSSSANAALDLQVTAATPSPNMTANVNFGNAQIGRLNIGPYLGASTLSQSVTFATSNASNPRIDYVVIRSADPGVVADGTPTQSWRPMVYTGSPGAVPVEPSAQLQDGDVLLAAVTIRANTTQVTSGDISDRRLYVTARGGITPKSPFDSRAGAYEGQYRDNGVTNALERWDGSSMWEPVATPASWVAYSPTLYYGGDQGSTAGSGVVALGGGASTYGRYLVTGKRLELNITWVWGTAPYNGGTGTITARLPPGLVSRPGGGDQHAPCYLFTASGNSTYIGQCLFHTNSSTIWFLLPNDNTDNRMNFYRIATQAGVAGGSVPNLSQTEFPEGGTLSMSATVEIG